MKTFEANQELENVFISHGFIETTTDTDKGKGKKTFKLSKQSNKKIDFNYVNVRVTLGTYFLDEKITLNEEDLKLILLLFKLKGNDLNEILGDGISNFEKAAERLVRIRKELKDLKEFNFRHSRQVKIQRILDSYDNLVII